MQGLCDGRGKFRGKSTGPACFVRHDGPPGFFYRIEYCLRVQRFERLWIHNFQFDPGPGQFPGGAFGHANHAARGHNRDIGTLTHHGRPPDLDELIFARNGASNRVKASIFQENDWIVVPNSRLEQPLCRVRTRGHDHH